MMVLTKPLGHFLPVMFPLKCAGEFDDINVIFPVVVVEGLTIICRRLNLHGNKLLQNLCCYNRHHNIRLSIQN